MKICICTFICIREIFTVKNVSGYFGRYILKTQPRQVICLGWTTHPNIARISNNLRSNVSVYQSVYPLIYFDEIACMRYRGILICQTSNSREKKIGLRNWEFKKSGRKISAFNLIKQNQGKQLCLSLSGGLRNCNSSVFVRQFISDENLIMIVMNTNNIYYR